MAKLQDDLLRDFKEQKAMIYSQLEVFDPMGTRLAKPAAQRLVNKGILIAGEILCYCLALGAIAFAVLMFKIYPFYILSEILNKTEYAKLGWMNVRMLTFSIYGLCGIISLLFYAVARSLRSIRLKNDILAFAAKHIKTLVSQHLTRKASIDAIEQRHFLELPQDWEEGVGRIKVNEVPNPGYESSEKH
ncbi:MAG: hypothetical protein JST82_01790 [Bacteroidetes bacterium]|nr:hypothetical protein [Bacteroidota bacterium]